MSDKWTFRNLKNKNAVLLFGILLCSISWLETLLSDLFCSNKQMEKFICWIALYAVMDAMEIICITKFRQKYSCGFFLLNFFVPYQNWKISCPEKFNLMKNKNHWMNYVYNLELTSGRINVKTVLIATWLSFSFAKFVFGMQGNNCSSANSSI